MKDIPVVLAGLNQFKDSFIDSILNEISSIGGIVLAPTISLCQQCHYHVPAYRYELNGAVYICKHCVTHGLSHHMIEKDVEFYHSLTKTYRGISDLWNYDLCVLVEVTDRCNLECPHCYHMPDNRIKDQPREEITRLISTLPKCISDIILSGAEPTLRKDFGELIQDIKDLNFGVYSLTNGIRLANDTFVNTLIAAGHTDIHWNIGLNHPDYLGNRIVREKQEQGIRNAQEHFNLSYISYSLIDASELSGILTEITTSDWHPTHFRIRYGSEIGRNATVEPVFLSDLYKDVVAWADQRGFTVKKLKADNNIYHQVIQLNEKVIRLIHWCDETNIDMEELRSGPWNAFVPNDGVTNFLHQIIRRDVWKNKGLILPDIPPRRYNLNVRGSSTNIFNL